MRLFELGVGGTTVPEKVCSQRHRVYDFVGAFPSALWQRCSTRWPVLHLASHSLQSKPKVTLTNYVIGLVSMTKPPHLVYELDRSFIMENRF